MKNTRFLWLLMLLFFTFTTVHAQDEDEEETEISQSTPYKAMQLHLKYLEPDNYQPEIAAKVIKGIKDQAEAEKLAIQIKQVMDGMGLRVYMSLVPDEAGFKDSTSQRHTFVPFPNKLPQVYLERGKGATKKKRRWYYSDETIQSIGKLHSKIYPMGSDIFIKNIPGVGQARIMGLAIWQILGIALMLVLAFIAHNILRRILSPLVKAVASTKVGKVHMNPELMGRVARMLSLVAIVWVMIRWLPALLLPIELMSFSLLSLRIVFVVFLTFLAFRILDVFMLTLKRVADATATTMDNQFLPIIHHGSQLIIGLFGIFWVLSLLSVNVAALVAGVSIGGLAIALAAQDTVKNLIGSVMIFADKPFKVGDFINAGDVTGVVEEVGFRSTLIRGIDTSLYSIPNGKLADLVINNLGLRMSRRYKLELGVTYDTPPELIDIFVASLKELVRMHPETLDDRSLIHLNSLGAYSINILIITYFQVPSFDREIVAKEEMLRGILRLADSLGVRFAFPSQALYIEDFPEKKSLVPEYDIKKAQLDESARSVIAEYRRGIDKRTVQVGDV